MATSAVHEKQRIIAIAIDGSKQSSYAFDWYVKELHRQNDKVVLIYSVDMSDALYKQRWFDDPYSFDVDSADKMIEKEKKNVQKKEEEFKKLLLDAKVDGYVQTIHNKKTGESICQTVKETNAEMIVIGSRRLGKFRPKFLGSVSTYVIHHSDIPIVICRKK